MKVSKFVRVDNNILIEYIQDDENLISEEYYTYKNTNTGVNGFLSTLESTKNYISVKNIHTESGPVPTQFTNQLVKLNTEQGQWGRFSLLDYSFIQSKRYGLSIPIRYDRIRVWTPINYTFGEYKGFHTRIYTLDHNNDKWIDLSNYFFDISDMNQSGEFEYSNPPISHYEMQWGKYFEIQFPSVDKISEQRINGITKQNTINYNLSEGIGLSDDSPIFIDFYFISSIFTTNRLNYYNLINKVEISFPSNMQSDKFSMVIEKSDQGDFFLIYPQWNRSIGEFNKFIEKSILRGNRYYLEVIIEVYEKNIKTDEQKIILIDNFIEEIEFRPILKWTTSTAIIDITGNLIDSVNGHKITSKTSYSMIQNEVSNYSRYLSKLDLTKAGKVNVYKIKGIETPNVDVNYSSSTLKVNKNSYVAYSRSYNITTLNENINYMSKIWTGDRKLKIVIFPFDNILKLNLVHRNEFGDIAPKDLNEYSNIKMTFKSDNKDVEITPWIDSDGNNMETGSLVFKIQSDKYGDIKRISNDGFLNFYISGESGNIKKVIYTGSFKTWGDSSNISNLTDKLNRTLESSVSIQEKNSINSEEKIKIEEIKEKINKGDNVDTSTNSSGDKVSTKKSSVDSKSPLDKVKSMENDILSIWTPYWNGSFDVIMKAYQYKFEGSDKKYKYPSDTRRFGIKIKSNGLIDHFSLDKTTGYPDVESDSNIKKVLGYFKIYDFNPDDDSIIEWIGRNVEDLNQYKLSKYDRPISILSQGSNVPPTQEIYNLILKSIRKSEEIKSDPKYKRIQNSFNTPFKNT